MKTILKCTVVLLLLAVLLAGCQKNQSLTGPKTNYVENNLKNPSDQKSSSYPLMTTQNIQVGTISVTNDETNLYVTYSMFTDWMLHKSYLHVASSLSGIPLLPNGMPNPVHFEFSNIHNPAVAQYSYQIPLSDFNFHGGDQIIIAANASVKIANPQNNPSQQYTAWGGDNVGSGPRWWSYIVYMVEEILPEMHTEMAMMRMNDIPTDFTYPWCSQEWYTYIATMPTYDPQTYYFYAKQKVRVGIVEIWRDNVFLYTKINMDTPYRLTDSHLNVQVAAYSGIPDCCHFPCCVHLCPCQCTFRQKIEWQKEWDGQKLYVALAGQVGPF